MILIINSANSYWGAEVSLLSFLKKMPTKDYSLFIKDEKGSFDKILKKNKIKFRKIKLELSPKKPYFYVSVFKILIMIFKYKINTLYGNNDDLSTLLAFVRIILFFRVKTILHFRNLPNNYDYYKKLMFFHTKVICNSNYTKSSLIKNLKHSPKNLKVIYNGHGQKFTSSTEITNPLSKNYFLTVGRLDRNKAQLDIIKAFNKWEQNFGYKYMLIGAIKDSNISYNTKVIDYLNNHKLDSQVLIKNFSIDLSKYYRNAIATIIPSHIETFGRVAIESGFWSTPVIARDIPALNEIIEHNKNGFLWDGTSDQLINYLNLLSSDKQISKKLGENLRSKVEVHFSDQNYYNKLKKLLK